MAMQHGTGKNGLCNWSGKPINSMEQAKMALVTEVGNPWTRAHKKVDRENEG